MHIACIFLQITSKWLDIFGRIMLAQLFMCLKVSIYIGYMLYLQAFLLGSGNFDDTQGFFDQLSKTEFYEELLKRPYVVWLEMDAILFYLQIGALILLMFISLFREFTPLRDRVNLASSRKDKTDFLLYRIDDLPFFMILV